MCSFIQSGDMCESSQPDPYFATRRIVGFDSPPIQIGGGGVLVWVRSPARPVLRAPSDRRLPPPADPDRRVRLLDRLRLEVDLVEAEPAALEARRLLGPELLDQLDRLVGVGAARLEVVEAERLHLLAVP